MALTATDINQDSLAQLQAQEQFPTHIEGKVLSKSKTAQDLTKEQVRIALEMMKAGEIPKIDIKKYPLLAGPVPQGYFDEVQENYGAETAKKYKDFASYFTDYVKEEEQEYIARKLKSVFNNPGVERTFNRFVEKLKKYSNGKQVSQAKLDELKQLTNKMGVALQMKTDRFVLSNAEKQKRIEQLKLKLKNLKEELEKVKKEGEKWEKEGEKWEKKRIEAKKEGEKWEKKRIEAKKEGEKWENEGEKWEKKRIEWKKKREDLEKSIKKFQDAIDVLTQQTA